jgi:hypothetical protein
MNRKEKLAAGIDALINGTTTTGQPRRSKAGRKRTNYRRAETTSELGTKEGETRFSGIISKELLEKIKAIAYWERTSIKDILQEGLEAYVQRYEQQAGKPIQPRPIRSTRPLKQIKPIL